MSKYTIELTGMNLFNRMSCDFCDIYERDTFYELIENDNHTGFLMCESCFQEAKKDVKAVFQKAIGRFEKRINDIEKDIDSFREILSQSIQVAGRHSSRHDLKRYQKEIQEENKKFGDLVICKTRCGNCDGNPGDRHLPGCAEMYAIAEAVKDEDDLEFTYKFPLGAIKRLIRSYYEDIQIFDEELVYLSTSSSSGLRGETYCYRMLNDIRKQLNKHGLNGKKIIDEVFDQYFKADYKKMKSFNKNHIYSAG